MSDVVAFVSARLDEQEQKARAWAARGTGFFYPDLARWMLRDVKAKRRIVARYEFDSHFLDVRDLAAIDSGHPDYKQEWAL